MPGRLCHGVPDTEAVAAPVDEMRVGPHPRSIVKAARAAHCRRSVASRTRVAFQVGDRHRAVVVGFDLGIGVELEPPQLRLAAAAALDYGEPRRRGDLVEQIAGQRVSCFWQHGQGGPRRRRRRGVTGKLVRVDDLASLVACVRPVDCELPRPERTEAFNQMLRYGGVVWIAAAEPASRSEPSKRLIDPRDPGFLGSASVAYETVLE